MEGLLFTKKKKKKNKLRGDLAIALIAGAAAGAIIGLLLAPDEGSVTLEKLKEQAKRLGVDVQNLASDLGEKSKDWAAHASEDIAALQTHLKETAKAYRNS